jgi:hypothetical protein
MATIEAEGRITVDRALELARQVGIDPREWFVRALEECSDDGEPRERGALVRLLWELQRATGRTDLRAEWRRAADALALDE